MALPSRVDAWERLRAAGPPDWVLRHSACVEALAVAMAARLADEGVEIDQDLVRVGAVLHDLGRSVTQDIHHAHEGADMLRADGADARLVAVVEHHTGAGIPRDEAEALGLPPADYTPVTIEEQVVAHADNLYSGDKRMALEAVLAKYEARGLGPAGRRIAALHRHLEGLLGLDPDDLEPAPLPPPPTP